MLADRMGRYRMLLVLLTGIAVCLAKLATPRPATAALGLLAGAMEMIRGVTAVCSNWYPSDSLPV